MGQILSRITHYFLPQSSNNQRARILHPSFLSLIVACFLTAQFFLNYFGLFFPRVLGYASNISPERLIELTNQERTKRGLTSLTDNPALNEAATRKAGDMFALNYWAHNSPTGRTPWAFFKEVGYNYAFAGENLARDFNDSDAVVSAWMDSPTHRDNILNTSYKEVGLAVINGTLEGVETTLVVQLFGSPPPTSIAGKTGESALAILNPSQPQPALAGGEATSSAWFSEILAASGLKTETSSRPLVNPFSLTKVLVIVSVAVLIAALVFDLYLIARRKMVRLSGRSLAHLIFLAFLLLVIFILQPGLIL